MVDPGVVIALVFSGAGLTVAVFQARRSVKRDEIADLRLKVTACEDGRADDRALREKDREEILRLLRQNLEYAVQLLDRANKRSNDPPERT